MHVTLEPGVAGPTLELQERTAVQGARVSVTPRAGRGGAREKG